HQSLPGRKKRDAVRGPRVSELAFPIPDELLEAIAERVDELLAERAPAASPYLSVAEAAELLRADRQRVYDLLSARRLTRHKDGRRVLVSRAELAAYL